MREAQTEFEKLLTAAMGEAADKLEDIMVSKEMQAFLKHGGCLLYTSPSPRDRTRSRMPSSA